MCAAKRLWSLLKRGVIGKFHSVSENYLPLYLNGFAFRHNERQNPDIFEKLISFCDAQTRHRRDLA